MSRQAATPAATLSAVWLGRYQRPNYRILLNISTTAIAEGKTFTEMKVYQDIKKRIESVVTLPAFGDELFPCDIAAMLNSRLTFGEAMASEDFTLMSRHRLGVAKKEFFGRICALTV
jgi:hypothetical protein